MAVNYKNTLWSDRALTHPTLSPTAVCKVGQLEQPVYMWDVGKRRHLFLEALRTKPNSACRAELELDGDIFLILINLSHTEILTVKVDNFTVLLSAERPVIGPTARQIWYLKTPPFPILSTFSWSGLDLFKSHGTRSILVPVPWN
jgi:hypothetical protein